MVPGNTEMRNLQEQLFFFPPHLESLSPPIYDGERLNQVTGGRTSCVDHGCSGGTTKYNLVHT